MRTYRRGNFGYVTKIGQPQLIKNSKTAHCENPLHEWCANKSPQEAEEKQSVDKKNKLAAKKVIRNALLCFLRSWGAQDFVALNAKDFLAENDSEYFNHATKGDSASEFFRLREVIFHIVSTKTKDFFREIEDVAVTLDKVTVHKQSFTVICTYFFTGGKLHVILNKLQKLSSSDYDGPGTANMLVNTLCETLGVSKIRLARILKHLTYDGVYANVEERIEGGGCLELRKHVIALLELDDDALTGN